MMTKHVSLIALLLVAACGKPTDTESSSSALKYPVSDGGACAVGETGCNGLGNAFYACVEDQPGQSHWGSPTLCPLGCVSVAPASNGLETDYCRCQPGSTQNIAINNRCVLQTCDATGAWAITSRSVAFPAVSSTRAPVLARASIRSANKTSERVG